MTAREHEQPESHIARQRGRHKIFLGALPGVGKTYRMLSEAHRRVARGEDVVIGFVETHGRPATADLLKGLEQVPLKRLEYRGKVFFELDTAALIRRKPLWALIDELAHTNVPGTEHSKRWQSVEDVLEAGINVISTVNIQHVESLNDIVHDITGVRVRETVPDSIIDEADEVELADLTPDALINRLKRGDIYHQEKVSQALSNFFRRGNIVALRELALRKTADEVDEDLHEYMEAHRMPQAKAAREHVVVAVTPRAQSLKLVRRGYRLATRTQGEFSSVYVRVPGAALSKQEEIMLETVFDLTRNLGGKVVELKSDSIAEELIRHLNESDATLIVMGQSARSRWEEIARGSIINKIMRETRNVDIVVVADSDEAGSDERPSRPASK